MRKCSQPPASGLHSPPAASVAWLPVLMTHNQDTNTIFEISIHDKVGEYFQRESSAPSSRWGSKAWVINQEFSRTLEFLKKAFGDNNPGLFSIKIQSICNILLCPGMKRVAHTWSLARSRVTASRPETTVVVPAANSSSRRSASRSHASSISGSISRLAISRSSRRDLSTRGSCRTSVSKTSRFALIHPPPA